MVKQYVIVVLPKNVHYLPKGTNFQLEFVKIVTLTSPKMSKFYFSYSAIVLEIPNFLGQFATD